MKGSRQSAAKPGKAGLSTERGLWAEGHERIVGIDEVGKGAWAGPLTVGIAILPTQRRLYRVNDSKQLTERRREELFDRIAEWCEDWSVGHASPAECDELGMSDAQRLATRRALGGLQHPPDAYLVDGKWNFVPADVVGDAPLQMMVKGDARSLSIAAASILAKVTRDRMMRLAAAEFPAYAFDQNKGYPCQRHQAALRGYGPSSIHRRSWAFMDGLPWPALHRPDEGADFEQTSLF